MPDVHFPRLHLETVDSLATNIASAVPPEHEVVFVHLQEPTLLDIVGWKSKWTMLSTDIDKNRLDYVRRAASTL